MELFTNIARDERLKNVISVFLHVILSSMLYLSENIKWNRGMPVFVEAFERVAPDSNNVRGYHQATDL